MVESGLKDWLNREVTPSDFYQLVGRPRLCRNREQLHASLEEASEYLFQFQNHKEKDVRDRARMLYQKVAEARRTISDESRWDRYDQDLIARLYRQFRSNPDFAGPNPKLDNLRRWLALVQNVEPSRIEELVADWTTERPEQNRIGRPQREMETQTHAVEAETEILSKVPASEFVAPPPPPARSIPRERDLNGPPPPPPKTWDSPQTPAASVILPAARQPARFSQGPENNTTALWIVMAAFLTALVLGMFALIIAWASGAFDRRRSDLEHTVPPAYVDGMETRAHFVVDHQRGPRFGFHRNFAKGTIMEDRA